MNLAVIEVWIFSKKQLNLFWIWRLDPQCICWWCRNSWYTFCIWYECSEVTGVGPGSVWAVVGGMLDGSCWRKRSWLLDIISDRSGIWSIIPAIVWVVSAVGWVAPVGPSWVVLPVVCSWPMGVLCSDPLVIQVFEQVKCCVVPVPYIRALGCLHQLPTHHCCYVFKRLKC